MGGGNARRYTKEATKKKYTKISEQGEEGSPIRQQQMGRLLM